jgi:hypothetical protein
MALADLYSVNVRRYLAMLDDDGSIRMKVVSSNGHHVR